MSEAKVNTDLTEQMIRYIKINRVSTTELSDAYAKKGLLDKNVKPVNRGLRAVGRVHYAPSFFGSNWHTHLFMQDCQEGDMVFVEGIECNDKAIFGSLVAKYAILYRQAAGIVVSGFIRDAQEIIKQNYPIWAYGSTPVGCHNYEVDLDKSIYNERKAYFQNGLMVADDSGVVFIPKLEITLALFDRLKEIEIQENIWFDCIDRLKYSTFETVCQKKYEVSKC